MKVTTTLEKTPKVTFSSIKSGDVFTSVPGDYLYHFIKCGPESAVRLGTLLPGQNRFVYPEASLEVKIAKEINITY